MSASPSEFLTFYRRLTAHRAVRASFASRPLASTRLSAPRPFSSFSPSRKELSTDDSVNTSNMPDDDHATNKKDNLDVQSEQTTKGKESKAQGVGGTATEEGDTRSNTERAKKDHPEAPDVVIGMQDERGAKGL